MGEGKEFDREIPRLPKSGETFDYLNNGQIPHLIIKFNLSVLALFL